jgi:hypothetical protein
MSIMNFSMLYGPWLVMPNYEELDTTTLLRRDGYSEGSPIVVMPPEIMLLIFSFVAEPSGDSLSLAPSFPDCYAVSQVCYRWRRIALACPELWTNLPQQHISWTKRALSLSGSLPVSFHVFTRCALSDKWNTDAGIFSLSKEVLPRARHIVAGHRDIKDPFAVAHLVKLFDLAAAPLLESLTIVYGVFDRKTFMGEIPSRLRRLIFFKTWANTTTAAFDAPLAELALVQSAIKYGPRTTLDPSYPPVAYTLNRLPHLIRLVFEESSIGITDAREDNSQHRPAHLPKLEYLRIDDQYAQTGFLFSWLDLPLSTVLDVRTFEVDPDTAYNVPQRYPHLATYPLEILKSQHLRLGRFLSPSASYTTLRLALLPEYAQQNHKSSCAFVLSNPVDGGNLAPILMYCVRASNEETFGSSVAGFIPILRSLPLTHRLRTLEVTHPSLSVLEEEAGWTDIARVFPGIQRIVVRCTGAAAATLLSMLADNRVFTRLDVLELERIPITPAMEAWRLHNVATRRKHLKVVVRECGVSDQIDGMVALQGSFGGRLEWDGLRAAPGQEKVDQVRAIHDDDLFVFPSSVTR